MFISDTEPSSVILSQTKYSHSLKNWKHAPKVPPKKSWNQKGWCKKKRKLPILKTENFDKSTEVDRYLIGYMGPRGISVWSTSSDTDQVPVVEIRKRNFYIILNRV